MKLPKGDFLGGLSDIKTAAEAMRDAVQIVADNKAKLEQHDGTINAHDRQLESLEKRYSELLYRVGELSRR